MTQDPTESTTSSHSIDPAVADAIGLWAQADPDPRSSAALLELLRTDPQAAAAMFAERLRFGTAGLRGALGLGPARMNRVIVRLAARAIAQQLHAEGRSGLVVIGHDARHGSRDFAEDSARLFAAHGFDPLLIDGEVPTPVVAYQALSRNACAAIVVTASHNPPGDNGYKVYWSDGAQIVPPIDANIEQRMNQPPVSEHDLASADLVTRLDPAIAIDQYVAEVVAGLGTPRVESAAASIVYTALHGVGAQTVRAAFDAAGLPRPFEVASQIEPDPDFSTVELPNPEEAGALDESMRVADEVDADAIIANDPDADRLGVAIRVADGWRKLTGDEIGCILADRLLARNQSPRPVVASSIVSSPWLETIADHHGAEVRRTLTGFKWIIRAAIDEPDLTFVFGYEEALGFACSPKVRDKDGVTAAVEMATLIHELAARDQDLSDHLAAMIERFGVSLSAQVTRRYDDTPERLGQRMQELRDSPPADLDIVEIVDHLQAQPSTNLLEWHIGPDRDRVLLRPSGTEPKLKAYLQASGTSAETEQVRSRLATLEGVVAELL
ncbi:MAG: phospho-sugar mutase [Acidimicrobiales bacterium]|nr:phospho-sugar mutase [Acidimicrobiales bacterium]